MSQDWAAVSKAIRKRVDELGWRQRELAERSHVSQAIVREIQHQTVERRRSARTLEALSIALGWHPKHLNAVLNHRRPPRLGERSDSSDALPSSRLEAIEDRLTDMTTRLDEINANLEIVIDHVSQDR